MIDIAPNSASVWIQLITTLGTIATVIITHMLTKKRSDRNAEKIEEVRTINAAQSVTLGSVHDLVNGDRLAKAKRIQELEAHIRAMGGEP
jgi:hypothetical protein